MKFEDLEDGILYRNVDPRSEDDIEQIIELENNGWERHLAFPEEYLREDVAMFPGLQVLAIRQDAGKLVGKISAVRFGVDSGEMHKMSVMKEILWDDFYANFRDPNGQWVEGAGMVVDPEERGKKLSIKLISKLVESIREESKRSLIELVTFQSRNVGFGNWVEKLGLEPSVENHREYVRGVLEGVYSDPVLSAYAPFVRSSSGLIRVINIDALWQHDEKSHGLGVRFDATDFIL